MQNQKTNNFLIEIYEKGRALAFKKLEFELRKSKDYQKLAELEKLKFRAFSEKIPSEKLHKIEEEK